MPIFVVIGERPDRLGHVFVRILKCHTKLEALHRFCDVVGEPGMEISVSAAEVDPILILEAAEELPRRPQNAWVVWES